MFRKVIVLIALFVTFSSLVQAQEGMDSGPDLQVSDQEIEGQIKTDEEGLLRQGNFGKFHLFGYGELHYNGNIGPAVNEIDFHRLVLGFGYDFTDRILFRAELDFEHAFKEPELEYAQVDFLFKEYFNVRAGAILMPIGYLNQHHEPPLFYSVERPELYRVIIPTSWQEGGAGFFGKFGDGFDYQAYAVSSLSAVTLDAGALDRSFNGNLGIRDGRNGVGEAPARDFAGTGRLQYTGIPGVRVGSSLFLGNTGQGDVNIDGGLLTILEGDAKLSFEGFELEGTAVFTNLTDAGNINNVILAADPTFTDFVASQSVGWYVEGAYHLFHHFLPNTQKDLVFFTRYEDFNTQFKMPAGFAANPANERNVLTTGLSFLPIPQVAIKADYSAQWNQANGGTDQFNLGIGFYY